MVGVPVLDAVDAAEGGTLLLSDAVTLRVEVFERVGVLLGVGEGVALELLITDAESVAVSLGDGEPVLECVGTGVAVPLRVPVIDRLLERLG